MTQDTVPRWEALFTQPVVEGGARIAMDLFSMGVTTALGVIDAKKLQLVLFATGTLWRVATIVLEYNKTLLSLSFFGDTIHAPSTP